MDEQGFRQFLKKAGKKGHVIDGLVTQVEAFETFLAARSGIELDEALKKDVQDYVMSIDPGRVKIHIRGVILYFKFAGKLDLAHFAHAFREEGTARTRQVFKLRNFRGVDLEAVAKLEKSRIINVEHMLEAGKTPDNRKKLSKQTGIPLKTILELVKLSDLSRLGAIKSVRARLYYDAGLDTPDKFTKWKMEDLRKMLVEFVERTGFDGIAPLPKELNNAIEAAKRLPRAVQY
ncbi:MAG TPA: DUF4332 domain-containing protein [Anaerolineales bacterium]|nr:DUF4332 domain-containing protein [Anaerolineales bacterium]